MNLIQRFINNGFGVVPLKKHSKKPFVKNWETTKFTIEDFRDPELNIGVNLKQSNLIDIDLDTPTAIPFGPKFLPLNSMVFGVSKMKPTHYIYKNIGLKSLKRNFMDGTTIAELRTGGQTVFPNSICESKINGGQLAERVWVNETFNVYEDPDIESKFNKLCAATAFQKYIDSDNLDMVKLASCLKRYTNWDFDERCLFINRVISEIRNKDGHVLFKMRDIHPKIENVEKKWSDSEQKKSGYPSLAKQLGISEEYCREVLSWIGNIREEKTPEIKTKRVVDFVANAMTDDDFTKNIELKFLVEGIVPDRGVFVLAGRPKSMKSFMALDLAYAIQNPGTNFLGIPVLHGDVLLLALEDNEVSMNKRVKDMGNVRKAKPTTFILKNCPRIGEGLEESIEEWCNQKPDPRLIIVDTFQLIKPTKRGNTLDYDFDYEILSKLNEVVSRRKIAILYIHHLSQADKSHSWDKIMGSTAHQGATDAMYMLDREAAGNKGVITGRGRNIQDFKYDLEWNPNNDLRFKNLGSTVVRMVAENKRLIYKAFKEFEGEEMKPSDVKKYYGYHANSSDGKNIQSNMSRMKDRGELLPGSVFGSYKSPYSKDQIDENGNLLS